jgi:CYTH domain-containing protein
MRKKKIKSSIPLEIERKFLLRRLPVELLASRKHEVIDIVQYYFHINGVWQRFRIATDTKSVKYIHTIKKSISPGVYEENEKEISKSEFAEVFDKHKKNYRIIRKTRYVIKFKKLKFEIDVYKDLNIVVLEIELPKITFKFDYPKSLPEEIIYELTGIKQFSNLSLSLWEKEKVKRKTKK